MDDLVPMDADSLVERYGGLVKSMARVIVPNSNVVDLADLEQAGMVALVSAADSYDASVGTSFGTYIRKCIRNALIAEANKCCGVFTIDPRVRLQVNQIIGLRRMDYSDEEIMDRLGMTSGRFFTLAALANTQTVGTDQVEDDVHFYTVESVISALQEIGLSDREITLVELLITNHDVSAIEDMLGISPATRREIQRGVECKIREIGRGNDDRRV